MDKITLYQRFKNVLASIGWRLFIWGNDTTEEKYWQEIYKQEKNREENKNLGGWNCRNSMPTLEAYKGKDDDNKKVYATNKGTYVTTDNCTLEPGKVFYYVKQDFGVYRVYSTLSFEYVESKENSYIFYKKERAECFASMLNDTLKNI